jgi:histone-lysine N-methyltransferase SETMAR
MSKQLKNPTDFEMRTVIWFLNAQSAWGVSFHPSYSPDLAPSDFHLFTHLKQFLGDARMHSDEDVKKTLKDWFNGLAADFYNAGTQKLVTRNDKCLIPHGDYVEK